MSNPSLHEPGVKYEPEVMHEVHPEVLRTASGFEMRREYGSKTPNGNPINGRWVLRDPSGNFVDVDQYRHDVISRNGFRTAY